MFSLAELPELVGFFSYSREDDDDSNGALSGLRDRIQRELRGQLGRTRIDFRLWQDKAAIAHGTLWADEIKAAVAQAVFFIPIVTPTAVRSRYCKYEFESFLKREAELGRNDLVFPILYIRVPALETESEWREDPVLRIIQSRQYLDWQDLRHRNLDSTEVGVKIETFCRSVSDALREPWLPPEERRKKDDAAARQRAEDARQRDAEATQRAEEEHRRQKERSDRQQAEEGERRQEASRRTEDATERHPKRPRSGAPSDAQGWTSALLRVVMLWKPVETLEQARKLTIIGSIGIAASAGYPLLGVSRGVVSGVGLDLRIEVLVLVAALLCGGCAVGTYYNSRVAAVAGFILSFLGLLFLLPIAAFAGVRGTVATFKLRRAGK